MPAYKEQIDRFGSARLNGVDVEFKYTYDARNKAFHTLVTKRARQFFSTFASRYKRIAPWRTGTLATGYIVRTHREYGKPTTVSTQTLETRVPYARVVEAGGRGRKYAGTRRAGYAARVFNTERRKFSRDVRALVERIYGNR